MPVKLNKRLSLTLNALENVDANYVLSDIFEAYPVDDNLPGCCGIAVISGFTEKNSSEILNEIQRAVNRSELSLKELKLIDEVTVSDAQTIYAHLIEQDTSADMYTLVSLSEKQLDFNEFVLALLGFQKLAENIFNPNTGNRLYLFGRKETAKKKKKSLW